MQNRKQILKRFLFPPIVLIIIFSILSAFALIYSFLGNNVLPAIQYFSYILSAYALTIICCRIPNIVKWIKAIKNKNKYYVRYKNDAKLRVKLSLYINVISNSLFSVFHLILGILYQSIWAYSLAGYYILLSTIRFFLLGDTKKNFENDLLFQWKRYRFCGIALILMNLALAVIVFLIIRQNKGFSYHFIYTIGMAVFTFIITTIAIINVVRYRKYKQPIYSATKFVSLTSAFVSMLSLETAMLNAFGSANNGNIRQTIMSITGGIVCIFVLLLGVYMVFYSSKKIKKTTSGEYQN